jgi:hypothetical protein
MRRAGRRHRSRRSIFQFAGTSHGKVLFAPFLLGVVSRQPRFLPVIVAVRGFRLRTRMASGVCHIRAGCRR